MTFDYLSFYYYHCSSEVNEEEDDLDHQLLAEAHTTWAQREWAIQHVLFPSMRLFLKPPKTMATDGTLVQVLFLDIFSLIYISFYGHKNA